MINSKSQTIFETPTKHQAPTASNKRINAASMKRVRFDSN